MLLGNGVDEIFHYFVINEYRRIIESLLLDWKLTVFSFFLLGLFALEYADLSNQGDLFSRLTRCTHMSIVQSNQSITLDRKKPLQHEQPFFFQSSSLFLRVSVFILLNKEFMSITIIIIL